MVALQSLPFFVRSSVGRSVGRSSGGLKGGRDRQGRSQGLVATKAHVILRRYVVLTWVGDNVELV
jgi:hypothetical protein